MLDPKTEQLLSVARLHTYRRATCTDQQAWELYLYNTELSGAYFEIIGWVEIALRNSLSNSLARLAAQQATNFGWYDLSTPWFNPWFEEKTITILTNAINKVANIPDDSKTGKIVAELNFGFWTNLLKPYYTRTLWNKSFYKLFPKGINRDVVHERAKVINDLRNRVAHFEPIFREPHLRNYYQIIEFLDWLDPRYRHMVEESCRLPQVIEDQNQRHKIRNLKWSPSKSLKSYIEGELIPKN